MPSPTPQVVQVAAQFFTNLATTNTVQVSLPSLPSQGNAIQVVVMPPLLGAGPTLTGTSDNQPSNTFSLVVGGLNDYSSNGVAIEWCPAIGAVLGSTYTVSVGINFPVAGKQVRIVVLEISGLQGTVDQTNSAGHSSTTSWMLSTGGGNVNPIEFVLVGFVTDYDNGTQWAHPPTTGYTDATSYRSAGGHDFNVAYKLTAGIETSSASFSTTALTGNVVWGAIATFPVLYAGALSAGGDQVSQAHAALSSAIPLASSGRSTSSASSELGLPLHAGGRSRSKALASFTAAAAFNSSSRSRSRAVVAFTNYASVLLTTPLYVGRGSIVAPGAPWSAGAPGVGDTVWYDPTNLTILSDGETIGTTANFSAIAQWLPSAGTVSWTDIVFSPFVSAPAAVSEGSAQLGTANSIFSRGSSVSSARATITSAQSLRSLGASASGAAAALTTQIPLGSHGRSANLGKASLGASTPLVSRCISRASARGPLGTTVALGSRCASRSAAGSSVTSAVALASRATSMCLGRSDLRFAVHLASSSRSSQSVSSSLTAPTHFFSSARGKVSARSSVGYGAAFTSRSSARALCDPELTTQITPVSSASSAASSSLLTPVLVRYGYAIVSVEPQVPPPVPGGAVTVLEESACFVTARWFDAEGNPYEPLSVSYQIEDLTSGYLIQGPRAMPPAVFVKVIVTSAQNQMVNATRRFEEHQVLFEIVDQLGGSFSERAVFRLERVPGAP